MPKNQQQERVMYSGENINLQMIEGDIAELVFDVSDSSVNIFNAKTVRELSAAVTVLQQSTSIHGLLIRSAKSAFIAGADISEFTPAFLAGEEKVTELLDHSNQNFNAIENLAFPVVVAINGFALGGGCELTLACDYRIACDDVRIGLPETRLGIIPGWGGTVRLPRIAGIETAIEWIAGGKEYRAEAALKAGVIDGVATADTLREVGLTTLQQAIDGQLDYQARRQQKQLPLRHNATEKTMAFMTSKAMVFAQAGRHYPAPMAAVEVIEKASILNAPEALKLETAAFIAMTQTPVALALIGIFLSDQFITKKAKSLAKQAKQPITKAAVLGAGIMGGGIAYQSALKNIPIKMKDIQQSGIDLGLSEANQLLVKRVDRGRLSSKAMGETLNRIEATLQYDGFDQVDVVVEAVVENPAIKRAVLAEAEQHVGLDTVIASNTSTICIDHLASALVRPENFCGMHFFNPVHAMPLVEVIRGSQTSDNTIATVVAYATAMGKKAIVVGDCPGFLVNRVLFPYLAAFLMLVRDGVNFQRIDKVMEKWGWPMGPAYLLDVVGIDTAVHGAEVMAEGFPDRMCYDFVAATQVLFEAKRLGQKTNQGFYDYALDKKGKLVKSPSDEAISLIAPCVTATDTVEKMSDEGIVDRMMLPMVIELARCLEEGVVDSPEEADMALIYGLGFPPFVGGAFKWVDIIGINYILQASEKYTYLSGIYAVTNEMKSRASRQHTYYTIPSNAGDASQIQGGNR
ncbi:MAG: 3-hydroxyacyl-CoA dehydrogenase/enoyl-CoA hydratase/3-hydroxybutyryl-CoA epimerase [Candidatus Endobugula sp.]|jgi:3-hydroxyacyl-CoA dehydrogenase/enoyl-CoA hydratase/3-hydroxybutyryl-CoA epimerase/enoyl-CoA isomerase